jgi:hypothetical protein
VAPSFYVRSFQLINPQVIKNDLSIHLDENTFDFTGYTLLSVNQRHADIRLPSVNFNAQNFFDAPVLSKSMQALIIIGGPPDLPSEGLQGKMPFIDNKKFSGLPVRPFLLEGGNTGLAEAILNLIGWQTSVNEQTIENVIRAAHPLVTLDALRIEMKKGNYQFVSLLAKWLLDPAEPANVKKTTVGLLGRATRGLPDNSVEAENLIELLIRGYEAEKFYSIDAAYINAFQSNMEAIRKTGKSENVKALINDLQKEEQIKELKNGLDK